MQWEEAKAILRPENAHMGEMAVDGELCTRCGGLCMENCPFRAWEEGEDDVPRMKAEHECFSCYNCMAACPVDAVKIVKPYTVDDGYWKTDPGPLPYAPPREPLDADGKPDSWNGIERAVFERRSVRNFKPDPVPEPLIRRVLEAGRFAPSGGNCQPWKFVVVTDRALIEEMNESIWAVLNMLYQMYADDAQVQNLVPLAEQNPNLFDPRIVLGGLGAISRRTGPVFLDAPAVILMACDDRAIGGPEIQAGICGQNMNLVANSLGIRACWVGFCQVIEQVPALKQKLGLRPPWTIRTSLVLGYPRFPQEGIVPRELRPVTWFRPGAPPTEE